MNDKTLKIGGKLDLISKIILFFVIAILPFTFFPINGVSVDFSKGVVLSAGIIFALLVFVVSKVLSGSIIKINKEILFALLAILVSVLLSIVASPVVRDSLFSDIFTTTSGVVLISFVCVSYLASFLVRKTSTQSKIFIIFSSIVLFFEVFHLIRIITGGSLLSGVFTSLSSTLIGSWGDLSILSAIVALIAFVTLDYASIGKTGRYVVGSVGVFSFLFMILGKEVSVLISFGIASMFFFVMRMMDISKKNIKTIPYISLCMVVVSTILLIAFSPVNKLVENRIGITDREVRPSLMSTFNVAKKELVSSPVFGSGVGRFDISWQNNRPSEILSDENFWNVRFNTGSSFVTTFIVMTGLLGLIAIILFYYFIARVCIKIVKKIFSGMSGEVSYRAWNNVVIMVFSMTLILLYTPGIFPLTFIFLVIGMVANQEYLISDYNESKMWDFMKDARVVFAFLVVGIFVSITSVFLIYGTLQRSISEVSRLKANIALASGDIFSAEKYLTYVVNNSPTDLSYRDFAAVESQKLFELVSNEKISDDVKSAEATRIYNLIQSSVLSAINYDKRNSDNWIFAGRLYTSLIRLSVEKSADNAVYAFDQARLYDPNNPAIDLYRADIYIAQQNYDMAKQIVESALVEKPNFIEAYLYLIEIQNLKNNKEEAMKIARQMVVNLPTSSRAYIELGKVLYQNGKTVDAISALVQARVLDPRNLSISYDIALLSLKVGDKDTANYIYEQLKNIAPNSTSVINLGNLLNSTDSDTPEPTNLETGDLNNDVSSDTN